MLNLVNMEDTNKLEQELERTKLELAILYEVSNAMRTTLQLDEILYIILTGVTAHAGLGFNRAVLFLINETDGIIEGKMGIGPESGEDAERVWKRIEREQMDLEDLISAYKFSKSTIDSKFNNQVKHIKIPLHDKNGSALILSALEGMPLYLTKDAIHKYSHDPIIQLLRSEELVVVPLKAKDKTNGIIMTDNFITKKPISKDDIRMLIMLSNQAGLAIENSQLFEKTMLRAHTDSLTGLWNHGYFQYLLQSEIEKSKATKSPLSLIMIDIDDFKIYNDKLGHQAGDNILKDLSWLLRNQSRRMDSVCRYGGEEFTIILPQTDKDEAYGIAERIRGDIQKHHFVHEEILPNKKLTVSLGLASFPKDGPSSSELILSTDKMLYEAKNKGKNNTCCATG